MSRLAAMSRTMDEAVAQLGTGPLTEESVQQQTAPLFSHVLASDRIYLANHSLGRPLGLRPLDTGWFARENTLGYERYDPPRLRAGGDAFLESTPPVLTYYQARSGQQFTLAITVERLREYGQKQLSQLKLYLADAGIDAIGGDADHGAFLSVRPYECQQACKENCGE
jgi:hypothetical protein